MIKVTCFVNKFTKRSLDKVNLDNGVNWIDVEDPTDAELKQLGRLTKIHINKLRESLDKTIRPTIAELDNWTYIVFDAPFLDKVHSVIPIFIFVSKNNIITIRSKAINIVNKLQHLPEKERIAMFQQGSDYITYKLLATIVSDFFVILDEIEDKIDVVEKEVVRQVNHKQMERIFALKKTLIYFRKAFLANKEVIKILERNISAHIKEANLKYFQELYEDNIQLIELEDTHREVITSLLDVHLSASSNNMNKIMKTLTIIAALIWVPTLIAGIYGMNFFAGEHSTSMPEITAPWGYPFALSVMIGSVIVMLILFKKKDWI